MCRHAAYIGPGIAPSELLSELDHGLEHQAYRPRELLTGSVCADGYGFGWFADVPARYAFSGPVWSDSNLHTLAPNVRGHAVMAAVRNATIAGDNTQSNCSPFLQDGILFSHNGLLEDLPSWTEGLAVNGTTDSHWIFQEVLARRKEAPLSQAVQETCRALLDQAGGRSTQLNLLACDGDQMVATRAGNGPNNSLYLLEDGEEFPDAWVVASEPLYDDPLWQPVEENTMVVLQAGAPRVSLRI